MATRVRVLAAAAVLAVLVLAVASAAACVAARLGGAEGLSGPSAVDVEDVIAGAIRITRQAAP